MTQLNPTRNNLPETTRAAVVEQLNTTLALGLDLALQMKQAHWNLKGPGFIQLHELFDGFFDEVQGWNDTVAERAVMLGGVARGTLASVQAGTTLPPYTLGAAPGLAHVEALSNAVSIYGAHVRAGIDAAGAAGDADTADLYTGISRGADKMLWFLEAHLHG